MKKRSDQEMAEQTLDAITLRLFTLVRLASGATPLAAAAIALEALAAVRHAEKTLGIGIRVE